jgi:hypothetical protein
MWCTKRGTYSEGDQAQKGIGDGDWGRGQWMSEGPLIQSRISGSGCPGRGICVMDGDGGLDQGSVIIEIHLELDLGLEPWI